MRWKNQRRSRNVEDRRGQTPRRMRGAGVSPLLQLLPRLLGRRGGKWGLLIVVGLFVASQMGIDVASLLGLSSGSQTQRTAPSNPAMVRQDAELADFVSVVLADTEETWQQLFSAAGSRYKEPNLVLFSGAVNSACGFAKAAMGPFYCPGDQKVYIDLSFYRDLKQRHGAPGDFAQAYVIAHEIGHHVQTLTGISSRLHQAKKGVSKADANQLSVRQELQADCFAGIWAHHADRSRNLLETGDIDEALTAAAAIGDDRLQQQGRGYVTPESFTHGSSEQRIRWFKIGLDKGSVSACDTLSAAHL